MREVRGNVATMKADTSTPRHTLAAYMTAAGLTPVEIASRLRQNVREITALTKSPAFQLFVEEIQREFRASLLREVMDRLLAEVDASIDTVVNLRDLGKHESTRLQAAFGLLDRIVPRKAQLDETHTFRLRLEPGEMAEMRRALKEAPSGDNGD